MMRLFGIFLVCAILVSPIFYAAASAAGTRDGTSSGEPPEAASIAPGVTYQASAVGRTPDAKIVFDSFAAVRGQMNPPDQGLAPHDGLQPGRGSPVILAGQSTDWVHLGTAEDSVDQDRISQSGNIDPECRCVKLLVTPGAPTATITAEDETVSVEVKVPYTSTIQCTPGAERRCSGTVKVTVHSEGWKYKNSSGDWVATEPELGNESISGGGNSSAKSATQLVEPCEGACDGQEHKVSKSVTYSASFTLSSAKFLRGHVWFEFTPEGCAEPKGWKMRIYVDSMAADRRGRPIGFNEGMSDYDGDGRPNNRDDQPWNPKR